MWVVVHLFAGLALGLLPLPYWALVLVVIASHVLMDLVPHWDYTSTAHHVLWGACDFGATVLVLVLGLTVFGAPLSLLALGVLAAAPDFDVLLRDLRGGRGAYWFPSHRAGFPHGQAAPLPGIAVQAAIVIVCALVLAFH